MEIMRESINITSKGWLTLIISLLLLTDIFIFINAPFLREIFSFLFFTLVPGILVIQALRLRLELFQKAVLSVGLSVAIVLTIGFALNSLYPFLKSPLSLLPVIITLNLVVIILTMLTYHRNQGDYTLNSFQFSSSTSRFEDFKQKIISKNELFSPILFPFLLPILAVLGTYVMNQYENNILLLLTLFLIPLYLVLVVYFRERINNKVYPLAVWLISLTLLLMYGLTSSYLMGRDIHTEFYCFQLTMSNFHWDLNTFSNPYNACLSITILPTMLQVLSGIQAEYVFKLFYAFIGSLIPLSVYSVAKKYVGERYAFFAGLLFVFQLFFVNILGAARQEIAVLFFFLAIMTFFESNINGVAKKILLLLFMGSTLVSHYSTAYVTFAIILPLLALSSLKTLIKEHKISFTNWDVILTSMTMLALWYFLFANIQFTAGSQVVGTTVSAIGQNSQAVVRGSYVLGILGIVLKSLPNTVSVIVHDVVFASILLGFTTIIYKYNHYRKIFDFEYLVAIILSVVLLVLFVVLPYISIAYDAARLFFQLVIFLAPLFVIGCTMLAKLIKKPKWDVWIIILILIALFSCVTYLQYSFLGEPYSGIYEKNGTIRAEAFIYPSEMASADWIKSTGKNLTIYSDGRAFTRLSDTYGANLYNANINSSYFAYNKTADNGYIFMGRVNIENGKIIDIYDDILISDIRNYSNLFAGKQIIYDNGGSQIWW